MSMDKCKAKLKRFYKRIDNSAYPFQSKQNTLEYGWGEINHLLFIGICPAKTSNRSAGESQFDLLFKQLLKESLLKQVPYYFTNICKTTIPKGKIPTYEQQDKLISHLSNNQKKKT